MSFLGRTPSNAPLTSADIPDGIIVAADLAPDSVDSSELVDGSIDTSHIGANQVTAAKVASDVATQAELDAQRTNSSITTLGTVTAGNLSNTAIVYPAGHIVNTWNWGPYNTTANASSASLSTTLSTLNFGSGTGGDVQITGITATEGNLLHITSHVGDLYINPDGSYNTDIGPEIDGSWKITTSLYIYQNTQIVLPVTCTALFTVPANFTNKTIKMRGAIQGGSGVRYMTARQYSGGNHTLHLTVFEIQQ